MITILTGQHGLWVAGSWAWEWKLSNSPQTVHIFWLASLPNGNDTAHNAASSVLFWTTEHIELNI